MKTLADCQQKFAAMTNNDLIALDIQELAETERLAFERELALRTISPEDYQTLHRMTQVAKPSQAPRSHREIIILTSIVIALCAGLIAVLASGTPRLIMIVGVLAITLAFILPPRLRKKRK